MTLIVWLIALVFRVGMIAVSWIVSAGIFFCLGVEKLKDKRIAFPVILILAALGTFWAYHVSAGKWVNGVDFNIYEHASRGDFSYNSHGGWFYPRYMASVLGLIPSIVWMRALLSISFIISVWLVLKLEYGWLYAIASLKAFASCFVVGNVDGILCALSFTWWGSLLSGLCKPYFVFFALIWMVQNFRSRWWVLLFVAAVVTLARPDMANVSTMLISSPVGIWAFLKVFLPWWVIDPLRVTFFQPYDYMRMLPLLQFIPRKLVLPAGIVFLALSLYGWA